MKDLEKQVWSATYAAVYVREMDLGYRRGDTPDAEACNRYSRSAVDIADSAVLAIRHTYDESELVHAGMVNAHKEPDAM